MKIDHVSIAGSNLKELEDAFARLGMKTDYGGPHSNGVTHMSLLGFDDGSYIELISVMKPVPSPVWTKYIAEDGGPCAWAVEVDDIAAEVARVKKLGITAIGPEDYNRRRPDGVLVEWQLGFLGDKPPGSTLPFLIKDKTPRDYRVKPSASVSQKKGSDATLTGVEKVVLGVRNLEEAIRLFERVYGWKDPLRSEDSLEGATLAEFQGTPVVLACPNGDGGWLGRRLDQFGDSPCAFLLGTSDLKKTMNERGLTRDEKWVGNGRVAWIPKSELKGSMLGLIEKRG